MKYGKIAWPEKRSIRHEDVNGVELHSEEVVRVEEPCNRVTSRFRNFARCTFFWNFFEDR